jgi:hypothetical protein
MVKNTRAKSYETNRTTIENKKIMKHRKTYSSSNSNTTTSIRKKSDSSIKESGKILIK